MNTKASIHSTRIARARRALEWLALGDSFGQTFFAPPMIVEPMVLARENTLDGPWPYTDDAVMARELVDELDAHAGVNAASLSDRFARAYASEPWRGYGGGAHRLFERIASGVDWELAAHELFDASGSYGNGAAMRVAPLGAYFADADDATLIAHAHASAITTHTHRDGIAGAIAVAAATAAMWRHRHTRDDARLREEVFELTLALTPPGDVRDRIERARNTPADAHPSTACARLGNGRDITAWDTVPFCLWSATARPRDLERAMWQTVRVMGDRDTTCAIVAGIISMVAPDASVPASWIARAESL